MGGPVSGWWRTNRVALIALLVLVPALVVTVAWTQWSYFDEFRASRPVLVQPGDTVRYAEATVGPVSADWGDTAKAPKGTRVVVVQVPVEPGHPAIACASPLLRETATGRTWDAATYDLSWESDDDHPTYCPSDATKPYVLSVGYIVPDDASGPFTVDLDSADSWPSFVSAVVTP
jgi:hypothetical protein